MGQVTKDSIWGKAREGWKALGDAESPRHKEIEQNGPNDIRGHWGPSAVGNKNFPEGLAF